MSQADNAKIEVLIVDDHALVREGLKRLLEDTEDIAVAGEAANMSQALALLETRSCHVAIVDVNLPGKTGIDLLEMIKRRWRKVQVLMLSAAPEEHYAVRAVRQGAGGYLTKDDDLESLIPAVRKIAAGGRHITPRLAELLAEQVDKAASSEAALTARELEVLKLIAQGKSTSQIAQTLNLSDTTIGTYRTRIQKKTGLRSSAELARYALDNRLIN